MKSREIVSVTLSSSVGSPGWWAAAPHLVLLMAACQASLGADLPQPRLPLCWAGRAGFGAVTSSPR